MYASSSARAAIFFSASCQGLSQETAERRVKVESACGLNALYMNWKLGYTLAALIFARQNWALK
jgi:hypothetical protein